MAKSSPTPPPPYESISSSSNQNPALPSTSHQANTATPGSQPTPINPQNLTPQQIADFNRLYRQVVRRTTRNSLGVATSTSMATVFPYMLGPAAASGYGLYKARKARHDLEELEKLGFKIRKRDLANGVAVGALQKLPLTFLLWGHDEVLFALGSLVEEFPGSESLLSGAIDTVNAHTEALDVPVLGDLNGLAEVPVDAVHDMLGIDGAQERIDAIEAGGEDTGGWHDSAGHIAQDVFLVAPVAAVVDQVADYPAERYDRRRVGQMPGSYPSGEQTPPPLPPRPKRT
ncbi:hypothetical protein BU24DRAFT_428076 [Aaosphaeria arxii CBS 175.79]|uniref:Uncharacterized protein n=1 Tax=Aaosphaeria arxii CBS 175.79 TaxID=1450172 RepID=A0A6A5XAP5_9PLEO|nr:uncharacterized protein BU24DRAFT_428076 [Aaosphaeria arxii CBS 175.79]KAF2010048.1 hypothetical protein BU24DRAFT_428076 [Aaosphaeria arxii CBS 175.79]